LAVQFNDHFIALELPPDMPLLGRHLEPDGVGKMTDVNDHYLTSRKVRERFGGVSDMTLWRWLNSDQTAFPHPVRINGRRYWKAGDLDAWEAQLLASQDGAS
jgi:predicted DNA-binding transcriptional regulator AlpA